MNYKIHAIAVSLGFGIFGSIVFSPQTARSASLVPNLLPSVDGSKACGILQTVVPCEVKDAGEILWGTVGTLAYPLGAEEMQRRHALGGVGLTPTQKKYLRPHFNDLVDQVTIHYNAVLLTQLGYPGTDKKIRFGATDGQTFGLNIYISDPYKTSFQQLALIGHELVHSRQYKQLDSSLSNFGKDYFEGYKSAGLNYENNRMEREAYSWQSKFIQDDCASQSFSGTCLLKDLEAYDYDFNPSTREVVFYLDGTSGEIIIPPDSQRSKDSVTDSLSPADKAAIADILRQSRQVPEPSATVALIALTFYGLVLQSLRRKHTKTCNSLEQSNSN